MANKVIIGIVGKHYQKNQRRTDTYIRDEVKQAIFDNGGIAIGLLSPSEEIMYCHNDWNKFEKNLLKEEIIKQIDLCDGIILQGGSTNEAYESFIAKYCYDNDIPCFGICAGQNSITDALGGTITAIDNPESHSKPDERYVHPITIHKDSKFFDIIKKEEIMVNSRHKNKVEDSSILNEVAFCNDHYPDVVEEAKKKFYIGVRFHPESLYKIDENMNQIFKFFIEQCKK